MEAVAGLLLLGRVHGHVGAAQQRARVGAVLGIEGDADAGADLEHLPFDDELLLERVQDAPRGRGGGVVVGGRRQHDRELVAAEPGHDVLAAHLVLQAEGHLLEERVAEVMAERVVHFLEAIEVHQHQRQLRARDRARASMAFSSTSKSRARFGRPVSASCMA